MFKSMLDGIKVNLGVSKEEYKNLKCDKMIYTGKPDEFFIFLLVNYLTDLYDSNTWGARNDNFSFEKGSVINECNNKKFNRTGDNAVFLNETDLEHTIYTPLITQKSMMKLMIQYTLKILAKDRLHTKNTNKQFYQKIMLFFWQK